MNFYTLFNDVPLRYRPIIDASPIGRSIYINQFSMDSRKFNEFEHLHTPVNLRNRQYYFGANSSLTPQYCLTHRYDYIP
ncbi:MAG: hypothetical protein JWR50_709 [Mucilaginibacter sp.]|nr:hypothetical protein [Mucilaginibacter sp.]